MRWQSAFGCLNLCKELAIQDTSAVSHMFFDIIDGVRSSKPVIPAKAGIQCFFSDL